ncbi:MAG: CoA-binding protein, partial [Pirellulales bacterium]|nr:CoA-binding protein [Pirellulales bacterium]
MQEASRVPGGVAGLDRMFRPGSVAIFGASPEVGTARNSIVRVLLQTGFPGDIYPINPRHREIEGLVCYTDVQSLPVVPDLALIITPGHTVAAIIEACGDTGIGAAIVFSSGFEEMEGGDVLARDLLATANRSGVAILGPNCIGAWSIADRTILSFGAAARQMKDRKHAPIAIVSQSGALGGAMANYLQSNGVGCAYMISVGNETQLDILDALAWTVEQDDVKVALLYVEGLKDGGRIVQIAERALARGVQIAILKSGVSELGRSATASHTGKIASAEAVYSSVFEQAGVISVDSLADLFLIGEAFAFLRPPRRSGDSAGGVSAL